MGKKRGRRAGRGRAGAKTQPRTSVPQLSREEMNDEVDDFMDEREKVVLNRIGQDNSDDSDEGEDRDAGASAMLAAKSRSSSTISMWGRLCMTLIYSLFPHADRLFRNAW